MARKATKPSDTASAGKNIPKGNAIEGIRDYAERRADYKQHFDDIGLHDPSTEAAILQQEIAPSRTDERLDERAENERRFFPSTQKEMNEKLSEVVTMRKGADEAESGTAPTINPQE